MKAKVNVQAIHVEITREVLETIFDECDCYDHDETGGRVVGQFSVNHRTLVVKAAAVIGPGPKARRTSTSFFQDGDYQTEMFRQLEEKDPSIEHLGNWHTHHVNGYPTLSGGDVATYHRIVNHHLHNLDFFYALLVTKKNEGQTGLDRYSIRHYILFRNEAEDAVEEISPTNVRVIEGQRVACDKNILQVLCPGMERRSLSQAGTFSWKGSIPLIDESIREIEVSEVEEGSRLRYYPVVSPHKKNLAELCKKSFSRASDAVRALESFMNREIYESATKPSSRKRRLLPPARSTKKIKIPEVEEDSRLGYYPVAMVLSPHKNLAEHRCCLFQASLHGENQISISSLDQNSVNRQAPEKLRFPPAQVILYFLRCLMRFWRNRYESSRETLENQRNYKLSLAAQSILARECGQCEVIQRLQALEETKWIRNALPRKIQLTERQKIWQDREILGLLYPTMKLNRQPNKKFLWKGSLHLIDESTIEIYVFEGEDDDGLLCYQVTSRGSSNLAKLYKQLCEKRFPNASNAIRELELRVNQEIYKSAIK